MKASAAGAARVPIAILIASVALNAALLIWLTRSSRVHEPQSHSIANRVLTSESAGARGEAKNSQDAIRIPPEPNHQREPEQGLEAPRVRWADVESVDLREYIANLRAIGCPEQIIRDLISASVARAYAQRAREIWSPPSPRDYWQKRRTTNPDAQQLAALQAISREQEELLANLLGVRVHQQQLVDTLLLQLHGAEQELLFLPDNKREAAMAALADIESERMQSRPDYSQDAETARFREKLKRLEEVLSPEELEEYRLRNAWSAVELRGELRFFDCTPEEFKALLEVREQSQTRQAAAARDTLNRSAATEQVRQLWGEERAREFEKTTDFFYVKARMETDKAGLPAQQAEAAWQLIVTARTEAERLLKSSALPATERQRQIEVLRTQTESGLTELLGAKPAQGIRRDLANVVWTPAQTQLKAQP